MVLLTKRFDRGEIQGEQGQIECSRHLACKCTGLEAYSTRAQVSLSLPIPAFCFSFHKLFGRSAEDRNQFASVIV